MKIDILGLQAFLGVADHGSFQRAAASLNVSPTALSHRLKKMEDAVGVELLSRTTRRVTLTYAGSEFLGQARRLFDELVVSYDKLRAAGTEKQKMLSFGCLPTLALNLIPDAVYAFSQQNPDVKIRIADRIAPDLSELVQSGEIEFALTVGMAIEPHLELKTLTNVRMVAFCPKLHPLAAKSQITPSELAGFRLIHLGPKDVARIQIESALGSRGNTLNWELEVHQSVTALRLVASGAGITIAPLFAVDATRDTDIVAIPLAHPRVNNAMGILTRRDTPLSPHAVAMVNAIQKILRGRYPKQTK